MIDQDLLLELTESYLKSLISGVSDFLGADFDSSAPFGELGLDSFYVLKIVKKLEADFGTLPKTLLFENFNVNDLARYFMDKHDDTLFAMFAGRLQEHDPKPDVHVNGVKVKREPIQGDVGPETAGDVSGPATVTVGVQAEREEEPLFILEKDAYSHPELGRLVKEIFDRYKNESSVSRGTRNIAPNLFIGAEKRGYFNYSRSKNIILVYSYTGPDDYFPVLAKEVYRHCIKRNLELNLLADLRIESIGDVPFSATPFGVIQRILRIQDFALQGSRMRRLRYQVSRFEKAGSCRTEEYVCGSNPETDRKITEVIDRWCEARTMVNPLVHIAREEILAGSFSREHRIFLTYLDDVMQNVVIISPLSSRQNGYLMDLEFYPLDMPLGGLEFAIAKIIEILTAEGCDMLSLGATLGPKLAPSPNADPEIDRALDDLREQNIFNDEGNLQFKNKFRPENKTIYLCRAAGTGNADNIIDIIMMIADPARMQTPDDEHHGFSRPVSEVNASGETVESRGRSVEPVADMPAGQPEAVIEGENRSVVLPESGYNPLNIPQDLVELDLKTDSWAELAMPSIDRQMGHLRAHLQQPVNVSESLRSLFPFSYFVLTESGRTAENLFCKAWPKKGAVLQNLLFPTGIFHQIDKGFTPVELPHPEVFRLNSGEVYKGNLDWEAFEKRVEQDRDAIAFVCIEVCDNAAGGYPVAMQHLRQVKALLSEYSIPLVIDGTRVLENAGFLIERETEYARQTVWEVAREILSCADAVVASLTKDFCVDKGGLIATNDESLFERLQDLVHEEGGGLDVIDKKLIGLSLQNRRHIETQILRRMEWVRLLWSALRDRGVPVVQPAGGHCVLIDVGRIPEFSRFEYPLASFLAWLYLNTGIRAAAHNAGMQKNTSINKLVRLAIPLGLTREQIEQAIEKIVLLFEKKHNIPEIELTDGSAKVLGDINARYRLRKYHNVSAAVVSGTSASSPVPREKTAFEVTSASCPAGDSKGDLEFRHAARPGTTSETNRSRDIAIVGMAGRYPKAGNMNELWENLVGGRDCIDMIPDSRYEQRLQNGFIERYRGGFVDGVDRFDSLFFNISPREAEMLDPQERLFLEVAWEAIEDAGYYPEILAQENTSRNVGVFVGTVWAMYQMLGVEEKIMGNNLSPNSFLWSIANRVSYWMNFSGPSLAVDTACSSSLTALYLACEAIHKGDCSAAIVGGVNLDLHQSKLDINRVGGTQSEDGVCRSFGQGANGYVAGEGVGAIFLKPLEKAVEDKDNIYAVIKSAVVNHGGRTSGYTVPSPKAQTTLILSALERANIDARSIGYIEAHGTGTELGDPIEITGLTDAFKAYNVRKQNCAIGSIKSNIGHLEAAAGVVGVCKVLLQMKHRKLVPSLHSSVPNEHIDFANSPFYVEQEVEEWQEKEVDGVRYPLRAGISSFGAGGANAHIVLEAFEYREEGTVQTGRLIFPLSARNEEQLRETAVRLRNHIQHDLSGIRLNDVAYTLQVGRKSFDCRLAIIAGTGEELLEKLTCYIDGKKDEGILNGNVKNAEGITRLLSRKEKEEFIGLLAQRRDPYKLAQLWIDGLLGDWQGFQPGGGARRVPLPTYPFADKRHWVAEKRNATGPSFASALRMHPLIDSNESTFERQLFGKMFNDKEFFIYDHLVSNIPTLPGVAYLELARKAGELATGRKVRKIRNIVWVSPLTVRNSVPTKALIDLKPSGDSVQFEVFSQDESGKKQLYSQGKLYYAPQQEADVQPEFVDLKSIRARCTKIIDGKQAYPLFQGLGLNLGPSFQVLQEVFKSENEVLGVLKIPEVRNGDFRDFILHPSLIDGSFQAGMAAAVGEALLYDKKGEMFVPYSIGEVEVLHPLQPNCYSYVTEGKEDKKGSARLARSNVLIVDEEGKILVRIRDSVGVPLTDVHEKPGQAPEADGFSRLYYSHVWEKLPLDEDRTRQSKLDSVLIFDTDESLCNLYRERLDRTGDGARAILVRPGDSFQDQGGHTYRIDPGSPADYVRLFDALDATNQAINKICFAWPVSRAGGEEGLNLDAVLNSALQSGVYAFLFLCQSLAARKLDGKVQLLYLYAGNKDEHQPHNEAVNGFARTVQLEHPKLSCKVLELRREKADVNQMLDKVLVEFGDTQGATTVRYEEQERFARKLKEFNLDEATGPSNPDAAELKENGVYLITGGAGGLGLIFAGFLARECRAKLVLTGRSQLSPERQARLDELEKSGAEVVYLAADVSKHEDVSRVVNEIKSRFGALNGIIHSAGVLRDSYLKNKTPEEMRAVLAPKVHGTLYLDEETKGDNLDFFVLFSSMSAVAGNVGQCDYAYANHFMDSFAARREHLRTRGERSGKTLSFNWSIWADGGMKLDEQTESFFRKNLGIKPLSIETGIDAFRKAIATNRFQLAVVEGVQDKVELAWGIKEKAPSADEYSGAPVAGEPAGSASTDAEEAGGEVLTQVQNELIQSVMEFLKLDADDIDLDKILLDLGFDSIGLATYANAINEKYRLDITPVLFFEYPSLREISKHLLDEYRSAVLQVHGNAGISGKPGAASAASQPSPQAGNAKRSEDTAFAIRKGWNQAGLDERVQTSGAGFSPEQRFVNQPIAIVGMSGVMPQSEDVDEFWENLKNARNLVTVIPGDRWNWEDYDGDPLKEENKSNSKWGGFMKEADKFDPLFFGISPKEAELMDPQQRIFLETVWKAVEDSGQKVSDLAGTKTGLFVGVATNDYREWLTHIPVHAYASTGNSHSVLANRISFLLDLHGPSAPLDTACSSSLVALHRAIESIHTGSSDMAIVGGVQVMSAASGYIAFSQAGMLAGDGKCKTFDKRANGYVRGEGSGAIFIKPLSMAEADGNHIYAIIKATAENHGGSAAALTAPNPNAQAELLIEAYTKANIDPATVGYIECHGTGTSLGDPIEIKALKKSFSELYKKHNKAPAQKPHCGLSSVKTNIGHLETAAGIAGILKVLLAIKHRQIPALIHFEELNPFIDLQGSPFYIVDKTTAWEAPRTDDGTELPRRAGISSFGFGGANAHIVLEEYIPADRHPVKAQGPQLIVLSAKNEDRLRAYVRSMLVHLDKNAVDLADFAYTLQTGRDEMPERLALVAATTAELEQKFRLFLDNNGEVETLYRGNTRNRKGKPQPLPDGQAGQAVLRSLMEQKDLAGLAGLWVAGVAIDWLPLYPDGFPKRISLPTYPFARERYWVAVPEGKLTDGKGQKLNLQTQAPVLHPLVHRNVSTLKEQKFASRFTGHEFYFADHVVETQKILPGVAYMEMARVAGELAAEAPVRFVRDLVWLRPIAIGDDAKDIEVSLVPSGNEIEFTVRTLAKGHAATHCTGKLAYSEAASEPEALDIAGIRQRCPEEVVTGKQLYPQLNGMGLKLGKSFQIVQSIHANESESLAVLQLPEHLKNEADQFWLHPALMDGSLHTAVGLMKKSKMEVPLALPYSVSEVQILRPLKDLRYGYATWADNELREGESLLAVNIQLLDESGNVLVRIKNFLSRPLLPQTAGLEPVSSVHRRQETAAHKDSPADTECYRCVWRESPPLAHGSFPQGNFLILDQTEVIRESLKARLAGLAQNDSRIVLVKVGPAYLEQGNDVYQINPRKPEDYRLLIDSLADRGLLPDNVVHFWSEKDFSTGREVLESSLNKGVFSLFHLTQALMRALREQDKNRTSPATGQSRKRKTKFLYVYASDEARVQPQHAAVGGFARSAAAENSRFIFKTLAFLEQRAPVTQAPEDVLECVIRELRDEYAADTEVRYQGRKRWVKQIGQLELPAPKSAALKERGVYLITGGVGGLGLLFAEYLARQTRARLALAGRSALRAGQEEKIRELKSLGADVEYYEADISDYKDAERLIAKVKTRFNGINGIIHAAGVIRDSIVLDKTAEDMEAVLAAKVYGTVNLDEAARRENLDFFALFSSVTAITGNPGQSDYAYANSFMDHFAEFRNRLERDGLRCGTALSFNWPLWRDGGMRIDQQMEDVFEKTMGIRPLETRAGLDVFTKGLAAGQSQILVMAGDLQKIRRRLGVTTGVNDAPAEYESKIAEHKIKETEAMDSNAVAGVTRNDNGTADALPALLKKDLFQLVTSTLGVREEIFSHDVDMIEYGLDSISLSKFFSDINDRYSVDLTPAVFFEYPTFNALIGFLCEEHRERLEEYFKESLGKLAPKTETAVQTASVARTVQNEPVFIQSRFGKIPEVADVPVAASVSSSIAVVGMACVMPQSEDIGEFWENLLAEKDLITEIPSDRWDWRAFLGDPVEGKNKTNSKWGGFMKEVDKFDAFFFGISPLEAELMDPQQRLFLETVWKTIEDAGHSPSDLAGTKTGVFVGVGGHDYLEVLRDSNVDVVAYASTGNTHSVLANRISYLLDLHGASEPVDTACSASLVAVHRAVEAISSGSCEMAIAGGVNVLLSPALYLAFGNAGMLASDGRCKTFDARADGYVRGEGAGAVLLKKLEHAVADGNPIYGVIRGTGVNHGGHATALTAPNPNAQAELIIDIYKRAKIDPNTVGYIEAHGTGTSLGDPVEINGLKKAFKELNKLNGSGVSRQGYCAIGSVKTNVGHLETAAGIAGMIKVLLSLKHKKIPANIHFETLNPHIRLEGSPFYIVEKTRDWASLKDEHERDIPRRAGISSFGFGGANAHVVVEEYAPPVAQRKPALDSNIIVPLSARTAEQLHQKAVDLLKFIGRRETSEHDLAEIAYTLQVGREPMEERVGFVVNSVDRLVEKLEAYIAGRRDLEGIHQGQVKRNRESLSIISQDEDVKETIVDKLLAGNKLSKLLDLWVKGLEFDWNKLYGEVKPGRISLPVYPFARKRYWVEKAGGGPAAGEVVLHPLLHRNTSDLSQQSYTSVFTGEEFFLKDYQISTNGGAGRKVLPAVTFLEMARAAVGLASPVESEATVLELHNIDWLEPVLVANDIAITIALFENGPDDRPFEQVDYEVYSVEGGQEVVHCQGQAVFTRKPPAPVKLDIRQLKEQMRKGSLDTAALYADFARIGINYGTAFQGLSAIHRGDRQLLAKLNLPVALEGRQHEYLLHPSLMDAALHACMALITDLNQLPTQPSLPIALQSLTVLSACTAEMFAWVRYSQEHAAAGEPRKLDVDLTDSVGNCCVQIRGLTLYSGEWGGDGTRSVYETEPAEDMPQMTMLAPRWDVVNSFGNEPALHQDDPILVIGADEKQAAAIENVYGKSNVVCLVFTAEESVEDIGRRLDGLTFERVAWIAAAHPVATLTEEAIVGDQETGIVQLLKTIKALTALGYGEHSLEWTLITLNSQMVTSTDTVNPTHAGIMGFSGSMANEYPRWKVRCFDLQEFSEDALRDLGRLPFKKQGACYALRNREWFGQRLISIKHIDVEKTGYRMEGVYVVVGGGGGLGEIWSRYVIEKYRAQVVWVGRRELDDDIRRKMDELAEHGKRPEYFQADARDLGELQAAYEDIKKKYPAIHGVVHSAVGEFDDSIRSVETDVFRNILAVKVDVSVRIAQVFEKEKLDFVLFFSSGASFARSGGMSGYSAGCAFKDTFALQLAKVWTCNVKVINWGYWAVGTGDTISDSMKALVHQSGQRAIDPAEGMNVLEQLLAGDFNQIVAIKLLQSGKAGLVADDEWIAGYQGPPVWAGVYSRLEELENRELPPAFRDADADGNKDMEELLYQLLHVVLSTTEGVVDFYGRWLQESMNLLASAGYPEPDKAEDRRNVPLPGLWEKWDEAKENWLRDPGKKAVCILVEKCMRALPDILTGRQKATDVIFPNSSLELVEGFYTSPVSQAYNEILAQTLVTAIEHRLEAEPDAHIRILEVGAGTGATTAGIIESLRPFQNRIAEYCYTDLSKAFLFHAESVFAPKAPCLCTRIFDVDKPIAEQNISPDRYDFVIAANVLHATRNIRNTLRNTKAVLRHSGVLLLNEISDRSIYAHLIFGLLDGWWLNEDGAIRVPGSPALYPESWKNVLREEGFNPVLFPIKGVHRFGQQIVLAVSDGVVRQKQAAGAGKAPRQKSAGVSRASSRSDLEVEV